MRLRPKLVGFGAFGTVAFTVSIGYFHFKNSFDSQSPSTSDSIGPKQYFRKLDVEIRRLTARNFVPMIKILSTGTQSPSAQMAADRVETGLDRFVLRGCRLISNLTRTGFPCSAFLVFIRRDTILNDCKILKRIIRFTGRLFKPVPLPPTVEFAPFGDPSVLCQMALDGIDIDQFASPETKLSGMLQPDEIDKFLHKSTWLKTVFLSFFYHLPSVYTEDELWPTDEDYCFERRLRNSREERRLVNSLSQLLLQSELTPEQRMATVNGQFVGRQLPRLLIHLIHTYRADNKPIVLMSLKILANSVAASKDCAQTVAMSDWLPLLSSMLTNPLHDEERILSHKILSNILYAFGHERNELPPHLYELHKPPSTKKPKLDIVLNHLYLNSDVFVHGLRGSAFRTWRQKDKSNGKTTLFWPKDWLAADVKEPIRVIAVDYSSRFFQLNKSVETFAARAQLFSDEFKRNGIGERPVVFICHSLGGLLVKQLLLDNEALLSRTIGILFMATPHLGTPVASQLGPYFIRPTSDILLLQSKSAQNQKLSEQFKKAAAERIPIIMTALECKKTKAFGREVMLVPIESGIMGKGPVYHLEEGHHNVCKPESRESTAYQIVFTFVNDALEYVKTIQR